MKYVSALRPRHLGAFLQGLALVTAIFVSVSFACAQSAEPPFSPDDFKKYSGLLTEMGQFFQKVQSNVQFPAPRPQSRLLPLLPETTVLYAGFPNYGETSHQALAVFRQELKENAKLRAWWEQDEMATEGPKIEDSLEKVYQLSQYLGDEIVVSAAREGNGDPKFIIFSEARKPGLKAFLPVMLKDLAGKSSPPIRVLDIAELTNATAHGAKDQAVVLVRPDFIVLGENLDTLRRFNARLEQKEQGFASTDFGRRLAQGYEGGATIVAGLDLEAILKKEGPKDEQGRAMLERAGFSDMKYLVWDHKSLNGQEFSQFELSFTGPRRGVASWLAAPGPMGSLDFVSPKAVMAAGILLKDPRQIFDEATELATASNPNAPASVAQMEQGLNLSLREDLFGRMGGEIALELDSLPPQEPVWRVVLKAKDPSGLLATVHTLLAASRVTPSELDVDGIMYYSFPLPAQQKTMEVSYAAVDGYLIFASGHEALAEAIRLHRSGESLGKSGKIASSLPPAGSPEVSALLYEDPKALSALTLRSLSPELADSLSKSTGEIQPAVVAVYGEENALREASASSGVDFGGAMMVAAIAVPNLLRARMAANESSAVANMRTANTAQITYAATYPQKGYAHDLATLGPNPRGSSNISSLHASLIDATLGGPGCTAGAWCIKSGYRFTITTRCKLQPCLEYVVIATPVSSNTGTRNFCSASDAVIRFQIGSPLESAITTAECRRWAPLQ